MRLDKEIRGIEKTDINRNWVSADVEIIKETEKALLLSGPTSDAAFAKTFCCWFPKSALRVFSDPIFGDQLCFTAFGYVLACKNSVRNWLS